MEQFKDMSREELEKELAHHLELVEALTTKNGQLSTGVTSMQLIIKRQQKELDSQQESMMQLVEGGKSHVQ